MIAHLDAWGWAWFGAMCGIALIGANAAVRAHRLARLQTQYRPTGRTILDLARPTAAGAWAADRPGGARLTVERTAVDPEQWSVGFVRGPDEGHPRIASVAVDLTADQAADLAGEWWWSHAR